MLRFSHCHPVSKTQQSVAKSIMVEGEAYTDNRTLLIYYACFYDCLMTFSVAAQKNKCFSIWEIFG